MNFLLGLAAKHWKTALVAILLSGVGFYAWLQHHEAVKYHDQVTTIRQAERDATAQAKAAQAAADKAEARNKALLTQQATKATASASRVAATASKGLSATQQRVKVIYRNTASGKAWQDTPIPASILQAIQGGGS